MDKKLKPGRKESRVTRAARTSPPAGAPADTAFDYWLENTMKNAYSLVLDEPIPEDLIRLISQKLKD